MLIFDIFPPFVFGSNAEERQKSRRQSVTKVQCCSTLCKPGNLEKLRKPWELGGRGSKTKFSPISGRKIQEPSGFGWPYGRIRKKERSASTFYTTIRTSKGAQLRDLLRFRNFGHPKMLEENHLIQVRQHFRLEIKRNYFYEDTTHDDDNDADAKKCSSTAGYRSREKGLQGGRSLTVTKTNLFRK